MKASLIAVGCAVVLSGPAVAAEVDYPAGYRSWTHVKSMVLEPGHPLYESFGGLHHIYANTKAMRGYRGDSFPDGSVIVFDLLDVQRGGNALSEGARKVVGVMQRDRRRFKDTGGWGFEGFARGDAKQRVVGDQAKSACFACHAEQAAASQYVFSVWRE
jgi:opacity protein-like surface antigen